MICDICRDVTRHTVHAVHPVNRMLIHLLIFNHCRLVYTQHYNILSCKLTCLYTRTQVAIPFLVCTLDLLVYWASCSPVSGLPWPREELEDAAQRVRSTRHKLRSCINVTSSAYSGLYCNSSFCLLVARPA